ncbi:hypothetical protein LB504_001083 [Fusarium proliferatum]|nr:hypothetical protein LB504_001083 [Fusarium proliferatum]
MAPTLLKKASQQFVRLSSCDSKNIIEASPGSELNVADGSEAQTSWKFRTGGSKRWPPFRGAFKNMRKNARSHAELSKDAHDFAEDQARNHLLFRSVPRLERGTRSPDAKEVVTRKLGLHPTAMASNSTLVIRNSPKRVRSSLQLVNPTPSSGLITPPSSEASDTVTTADERSTAKTSMESSMLPN